MSSAKEGTYLGKLLAIAVPICKQAAECCRRSGPGRKPEIPDWVLAALIMVVTLKKKKSKNAQVRWITNHRKLLLRYFEGYRLPCRSTYFDRFRRAHQIMTQAILLMGRRAIRYGWADASAVAVDKSLLNAKGPIWWMSDRKKKRIPLGLHGVDRDSQWGFSGHHGWVQGYAFEVVVSCGKKGAVWPLLASTDTANMSEHRSFGSKIRALPRSTRFVLADSGYDNSQFAEQIEWAHGKRTGVRFICPQNKRAAKSEELSPKWRNESKRRYNFRVRRAQRKKFLHSRQARSKYKLRSKTVEPFNEWFKSAFELNQTVWHRGLDNNRTQVLAAIFAYQVLMRLNYAMNSPNGQIRKILDSL